jgi:hypothetical protein
MSPPDDDELDYLLSRGKLGGSQRERILKAALSASREGFWERWRGKIAWSAGGLAFATGAAVLLLVLRAPRDDAASFQVKGPGDAPLIVVSCLGAQVNACPSGSKVAFALEGGRDKGGFLTAYAQPSTPGERVWYLTNEAVVEAATGTEPRVIRKAALIGNGHPPGSYRVHAFYTRRPVAREALADLAPGDTLAKVELDLVVSP